MKYHFTNSNLRLFWKCPVNFLERLFIGILLFVCFLDVRSQNLSDLRLELLDEENGLSNIIITNMARDSSGFLWICTLNGLNRYDGNTFKIFKHSDKDSSSLLHDKGQQIYVDASGKIWIGYREGGISYFNEDCQCFTHLKMPVENNKEHLPSGTGIFYVDSVNTLWYGGVEIGLNSYNLQTGKITRYNLPKINTGHLKPNNVETNSINSIYVDQDGLFWICTDNGLFTFDRKKEIFSYKIYSLETPKLSYDDFFLELIPEGNKGFWLAVYGGGVCYFDLQTEQFTNYKYNKNELSVSIGNVVRGLYRKNNEELWVTTEDKGLGTFNTVSKEFHFMEGMAVNNVKLTSMIVHDMIITPDHVLFMANDDGLLKYNPYVSLFNFHPLLPDTKQKGFGFRISKVIEDPDLNTVYFATDLGNGLNILDSKSGQLQILPIETNPFKKERYMRILDMTMDNRGRLWVLSVDFLYLYDKIRKKLIRVPTPFKLEDYKTRYIFKSMTQDNNGNIWILTDQGSVHQFHPDPITFSEPINSNSIDTNSIEHCDRIAFDKLNRIWLQGGNRIGIFNQSTQQFEYPIPADLQSILKNGVNGMTSDSSGNIWMAIQNKGLLKIDTKNTEYLSYKMITDEEGLPTNRIYNISNDPEGNLWLTTILGVIYMKSTNLSFRIYNQAVGMDKSFWSIKYSCAGNNSFYITSKGRYCRVDFGALNRKVETPKIFIDKFRISNIEQAIQLKHNMSVSIKPNEDFFSFEFGCIDFTNQAHNKFAYMLEGWDKSWIESGSRRYASYTNLDGGNYRFKVKVANSEGIYGSPIEIAVIINTPFYKKTWFVFLVALLFVIMIFSLYQYRIKQIEKTEHLKTEFNKQLSETRMEALRAQMNPHFIFNCLNSINRYVIKSDIKTASLYITRFAKLIRLILDNSEYKKVVLANELEALKLYIEMEALRFDHKFSFEIHVDDEVDTSNIEIPPLIIQPYVENAIWHGLLQKDSGGNLKIHVSLENEILTCEITDNGIGRQKAMEYKSKNAPTRKSIGMKLTEERLNMASDEFSNSGTQKIIDLYDENGLPAGTKVIITIPV